MAAAAALIQPAMEELIREAAQGEVLHNDDTPMPVLALEREGEREARDPPERPTPGPADDSGTPC